jgi:hypothetical protein
MAKRCLTFSVGALLFLLLVRRLKGEAQRALPSAEPLVIDLPFELAPDVAPPDYACVIFDRAPGNGLGVPIDAMSIKAGRHVYSIAPTPRGSDEPYRIVREERRAVPSDVAAGPGRDSSDAGAEAGALVAALDLSSVGKDETWLGTPRFSLPENLQRGRTLGIHCERRIDAGQTGVGGGGQPAPSRVLWFAVRFDLTTPVPKAMTLESWRIKVRYKAASDETHLLAVKVLGGHYLAQPGQSGVDRIKLPLVPLWRTVRIEVPEIQVTQTNRAPDAAAPPQAEAPVPGTDGSGTLSLNLEGRATEPAPIALPTNEHSLPVPLLAAGARAPEAKVILRAPLDPSSVSVLEQSIRLQDVPASIRLAPKEVAFVWERAELYRPIRSTKDCPTLTAISSGVACRTQNPTLSDAKTGSGGECTYVCGQPSGKPVDLPLRLRFRSPADGAADFGRDEWEDTLWAVNQRVRGYVTPAQRFVMLDFARWLDGNGRKSANSSDGSRTTNVVDALENVRQRPGHGIRQIEIVRPDGSTARIVPQLLRQRVAIPGIEATDRLSYRIVGTRDHEIGVASYDPGSGAFTIEPPSETSRRVDASVSLGAGLQGAVPLENAWEDASKNVRRARPMGIVRAVFAYHPKPWRAWWEVGGSLALVARDYALLTTDTHSKPELASVAYDRILGTAALVVPVSYLVSQPRADSEWVLGIGAGGAFPALEADRTKAGDLWLILAANIGLRLPFADRFWVEPTFQISWGDQVYRHVVSSKLDARPQMEGFRPVWLSGDVAVRYGF